MQCHIEQNELFFRVCFCIHFLLSETGPEEILEAEERIISYIAKLFGFSPFNQVSDCFQAKRLTLSVGAGDLEVQWPWYQQLKSSCMQIPNLSSVPFCWPEVLVQCVVGLPMISL